MNIWEVVLGCFLGSSVTALLFYFQKPTPPQIIKDEEEILRLQRQLKETESLQKRVEDATQKKESYKKLVDIHHQEIERLKEENLAFNNDNLSKLRRIAELEMYVEDPTLFSHSDKEMEFLYKQLKIQFQEKCKELEGLRSELLQTENKLILVQKEREENSLCLNQLKTLGEEKQKLEAEVLACQELITKLSVKKKKNSRKSAVTV
jgi:hypothetical protein